MNRISQALIATAMALLLASCATLSLRPCDPSGQGDAFSPNRFLPYWEGLCRVYDLSGRFVGYAIEETTAAAHPLRPKS